MLTGITSKLNEVVQKASGQFSVAIECIETGEKYLHEPDVSMYAASIIKIPVMVAIFEEAHHGRLRLDERISVQAEDMVTGSGSLQYLTPGTVLSILDLVTLMIIESDNTATNLLIDRAGLEVISRSMKEWGLTKTQLHHRLQILPARQTSPLNSITAGEITTLLAQMARGQVVSYKACRKMIQMMKWQMFNDGIPSLLPEEEGLVGSIPKWELAHKTGWITGIAHDAGILYLRDHSFAISICAKDYTDRTSIQRSMGEIGHVLYDAIYD